MGFFLPPDLDWERQAQEKKIAKEKEEREKVAKKGPAALAQWEEAKKKKEQSARMRSGGKMKVVM